MTTTDDRVDAALAALPYDKWRMDIDPYGAGLLDEAMWRQIIRTAIEAADDLDRAHTPAVDWVSQMVPMTPEEINAMGGGPAPQVKP